MTPPLYSSLLSSASPMSSFSLCYPLVKGVNAGKHASSLQICAYPLKPCPSHRNPPMLEQSAGQLPLYLPHGCVSASLCSSLDSPHSWSWGTGLFLWYNTYKNIFCCNPHLPLRGLGIERDNVLRSLEQKSTL